MALVADDSIGGGAGQAALDSDIHYSERERKLMEICDLLDSDSWTFCQKKLIYIVNIF